MLTKNEFLEKFSTAMEQERIMHRYSQAEMARALDMSLSSYKRIISGENHKIDFYTVYRMQQLTGKFMDELCGCPSPFLETLPLLRRLSEPQLRFIHSVMEFEINFSKILTKDSSGEDYITLLIPSGNMQDGMIYDSCSFEKINVSAYRRRYGDRIDYALRITSTHFQPLYHPNDILLICRSPIRDGDTGVFFDNATGRFYIRKFRQTEPNRLEPLTSYGDPILLDNRNSRWLKLGYVITKMRT